MYSRMSFAERITCKLAKIGIVLFQVCLFTSWQKHLCHHFSSWQLPFPFPDCCPLLSLLWRQQLRCHWCLTQLPSTRFHLFSFLRSTSAKCILKKPQAILLGALVMMFSYVSAWERWQVDSNLLHAGAIRILIIPSKKILLSGHPSLYLNLRWQIS